MMTAMVRIGALRGYRDLVRALGCKPDPLLRKHRVPPALLTDEDAIVPLRNFVLLLEASAQQFDCPDFGLRLGATQDIDVLGPLAVGMQNAGSMADALDFASRFLFVQSPAIAFTVREKCPGRPGLAELRFDLLLERPPVARQFMDLSLAAVHRIAKLLGSRSYVPEEAHIPHAPVAALSVYSRMFGCPVRVEMPSASLLLRAKVLYTSTRSVDPRLVHMAETYLTTLFPKPGEALSARVRGALRQVLGTPLADKTSIASMLALHPRTLQRRLAEEGASFDGIRDEVRRDLAQRYLFETTMPLIQVVSMLGLSEPAALTRMCRRWFDKTPSQIRRETPAEIH